MFTTPIYRLCLTMVFFAVMTMANGHAQKFGYVDSEYILNQLEEYKQAEKMLDSLSANWQQEVNSMYTALEDSQKKLVAEKILLTLEMIEEREEKIAAEKEATQKRQEELFGFEGLYFQKRQELVKEIQDKVFESIATVAKKKKLQIIFDKSSDLTMLYTNPVHDYTEYVMEELGFKKEEKEQEKNRNKKTGSSGGGVRSTKSDAPTGGPLPYSLEK